MNKQKKTDSSPAAVHQNGGFGSSLGFVLACVGSAVGMGNIWMFPYRVGQYGGGAVSGALYSIHCIIRPGRAVG